MQTCRIDFTTDVPDAAVLGSFWATPSEGRLTAMVAGWREESQELVKEAPCTQLVELLLANVGAEAAIELHDKTIQRGRIQQVLTQPSHSTPFARKIGPTTTASRRSTITPRSAEREA